METSKFQFFACEVSNANGCHRLATYASKKWVRVFNAATSLVSRHFMSLVRGGRGCA